MKIKYQIKNREDREFKVGDYVVVLPNDRFYYQRIYNDVVKINKISIDEDESLVWYSVENLKGQHLNAYNLIRHATLKELMDNGLIIER